MDITEQIPFEIPENWVWTRLGQIGDWGAGSTPQRGNANYYNGNILWLKTGELNNCKKQVFDQQFSEKLVSVDFGKQLLHILIDKAVMRQRAAASLLGA